MSERIYCPHCSELNSVSGHEELKGTGDPNAGHCVYCGEGIRGALSDVSDLFTDS